MAAHSLALALAVVIAALLNPALAQAAKPGDLDGSFGGDGKVITDFGGGVGGEITSRARPFHACPLQVKREPRPIVRQRRHLGGCPGCGLRRGQ
jgi:hypothetical protein